MKTVRWLHISMAALALVTAAAAPVSADEWYEHYARAEAALAKEDHQTAIDELTRAIERRGDSGARVRTYGMRAIAYFPYLKLGIAYFLAGENEAALRAFDTEERLGAIDDSDAGRAELARYRRLANGALDRTRAERQREVDELVEENLTNADELFSSGRLDEALAAVGRALALAPNHPEAGRLAAAIRERLSIRDERRSRAERASTLIEEGRRLRAEGRLNEAAARFRQAVELHPGGEAGELLAEVQEKIANRTAASAAAEIIRRASELLDGGDHEAALAMVQGVVAADPGNVGAAELERRILSAIENDRLAAEIDGLLADARTRLAAGDTEGAITAANLVLARDPGDTAALELITRAYTALSRRLLGEGAEENLPPAIRFADMRLPESDGSLVQTVHDGGYRLSGVVIDDSEVAVEVTDDTGAEVSTELVSQQVGGVRITEFQISASLPPGRTALEILATDRHGLSSRSEYAVVYRRPFIRSPGFWGGLIAILVLALAGFAVGRAAHRTRLLRRRFNPFVAGPPVLDPELFVGREVLLERVLATLPNNSLLLLGERRIGKTSLLHQLRLRLDRIDHPRFHFVPIYIDLQGTPEDAFFAALAAAIGEVVDDPRMADSKALPAYDSADLVRDLRRLLPTIDCPQGRRVKLVLMLDEIDELNGYSHRTNQRLRSLFMRSFADQMVAVAAGVGISRRWDHAGSPWYNFFEELKVGPVDAAAAKRLLTRPLKGAISIDRAALDLLLRSAAGRPYLLQKTALAVIQRLHAGNRRRITADDVEAVIGEETGSFRAAVKR